MSMDWYPGIREACAYWHHAPMLQQTFAALEQAFAEDNDACIDCAKSLIEAVCQIIFNESSKPPKSPKNPGNFSLSDWLTEAVHSLNLGDIRDENFKKLTASHTKLAVSLNDLRNNAGPVSHGKDGFIKKLSIYHRRSAVLAADAIIAFLHQAYLEAELELEQSHEPYECDRFTSFHEQIDGNVSLSTEIDENGLLNVTIILPTGDTQLLLVPPSRLLYQLDRIAYRETLNAVRSISPNTDAI